MTIDPVELERLSKAADQEDDDVRYYGGPTSTHRPARDAYHAALVQLHRTGQLVPAQPSGDEVEAVKAAILPALWSPASGPVVWDDQKRAATEQQAERMATAAITAYEAVSGVAKMREEGVKIGLEAAANAIQAIVDHAPNGSLGRGLQPIVALLSCLDPAAIARAALGEKP